MIQVCVAAASVVLLFLPFERLKSGYTKLKSPSTLAGVIFKLVLDAPDLGLKRAALSCIGALALLMVASPAMVLAEVRWLSPLGDGARAMMIVQGVLIVAAAAATFLIMTMNNMVIGFGSSALTKPTVVFWLILVSQGVGAVGSVVVGVVGSLN